MVQPLFAATIPDASIITAVAAVFSLGVLAIRTLYADGKAREASHGERERAMLETMLKLTNAVEKLRQERVS